MNRFLFTADCHIKRRTWVNHVNPQGDSYEALRVLKQRISEYPDVDTLVIGGDFFDGNRPTSADEMAAVDFLSAFRRVMYVRGNHDNVSPSYLEALLSRLTGVELVELTTEGYALEQDNGRTALMFGVSWTSSREELLDALTTIAGLEKHRPKYVVLHTAFQHLLPIGKWQISKEDIESIFSGQQVHVLVGDIHTRHTLDITNGYIHSPGSTYPTAWPKAGETYQASFVDLSSGGITPIDCTVRDYVSVAYEDEASLQAVYESTKGLRRLPPVIRLQMASDATWHINPADYPDAIILCQKAVSGQKNTDGVKAQLAGMTLADAVRQESLDESTETLAVALLSSDDPVGLLSGWLDYWKVERIV